MEAHEDIWDDSALINSWNEALTEYKKYHSIHATGGKLEDLAEHAKPETSRRQDASSAPRPVADDAALSSHQDDRTTGADEAAPSSHQDDETTRADGAATKTQDRLDGGDLGTNGHEPAGASGAAGVMPPPQALLGSVQDEGLKRLLMSWYYAGYYTGLYEGQQKQQ